MSAERALADLAQRGVSGDSADLLVGIVTQIAPTLLFRPDGATNPIGPISVTAGVTPAMDDQIAVIDLPWASPRFICIGVVTRA